MENQPPNEDLTPSTQAGAMNVGLIGTGRIGAHMAANLLRAGHRVYVHDINKTAAADLIADGAVWANSPAEMAAETDVTIASLPGPLEVESVALGVHGVLAGARKGHVYIDTTSSYPSLIQRISSEAIKRGVDVIDAPLTGGTSGAEAGTLIFIAGGEAKVLERVQPILSLLGKKTVHMGSSGAGCAAKLVNNMLGQIQIYSFAEALGLAAKFGLDVKQVVELLSQGQTGSGILTHFYANKGLKGDFEPGFTVDLAFKDQALISQLGRELGVPLYFNALVVQRIADMRARGLGAKDHTAAILPLEELLHVKIRID